MPHDQNASHNIDRAAYAALAVDCLPTFFGAHTSPKADFTNAFPITDFVRIMHG